PAWARSRPAATWTRSASATPAGSAGSALSSVRRCSRSSRRPDPGVHMRSRSLRRGVTAVLVGVLAVVGCSDRGDTTRAPSATVRKEPPATTTSVVPVDRVPAVIDVAYVQAVIDVLDHVEGDAVRA